MEKIENSMKLCEKINKIIYTDNFYSISQIKKIINSNNKNNFDFYYKGINDEAEKNILAISPLNFLAENNLDLEFPVKFFKILNKSKFKTLEHKHYLGTILSFGIKREVLGDLIVKNNVCYGIIRENMFIFLKENLTQVNYCPVEIIEIDEEEVPDIEFQDLNITINSLRLDSFISAVTNLSRNFAVSYIEEGNVQVNYELCREKNFKLKEEDIISIRKYGKYKIGEKKGLSKKSKLKIIIKKYI